VCGRSPAEIVGLNPTGGHGCLSVVSVVWGLCDELITRPEESYRLWCVVVCGLETARIKADSHIACRAHAVSLPCRAAKGLECVFLI
jgi:hypothetical protein